MTTDTIFALASGRPPAAIAIVRISGPGAHAAGSALAGRLPAPRKVAVSDLQHPRTRELLDRALVLRFDAPASATGEDVIELHCHGGRAVVDCILAALAELEGLRPAEPGEFTRRAFESGRIDLTEAEGLADLLAAETQSQRKAALQLSDGGLRRQIDQWRMRLLELSARAEAAIDYVDEDDVQTDPGLPRDCEALAEELTDWLARPPAELLREGVRVVVAGPPNAGKSSLINAMLGEERSIVTDVPGTTRDQIETPLSLGGTPIILTDTAGLRDTEDVVERIGIARTRKLLEESDVLVWLGDPREAPAHERVLIVHAKCDLPSDKATPESLSVSAHSGEGVAELMRAVSDMARDVLPAEGIVALNRRQATHIAAARDSLAGAARIGDQTILAEHLRIARGEFDKLTGRTGTEDVLDALFGRFCLGK